MTTDTARAEWLSSVPSTWTVAGLGRFARSIQTGPFGSQLHADDYIQGGIPLINPSHIRDGQIEADALSSVSELTARKLVRHALSEGDIIFARRGELGRCAVVCAQQAGWLCGTGSMVVRTRPELMMPEFLWLASSLAGAREWLHLQSVGSTMDNLNASILGRLPIPCPPIELQDRIVRHVFRRTALLDDLIEKKERLLALLHEKQQALTTEAVTLGLDSGASTSQSELEWSDRTPIHWKTERIRFLFKERNLPPSEDDGVVTAFRDGQVVLREKRRSDGFMLAEKEVGYQHVVAGDLVVHSMDAFAGAIGISEDDGKCSPEYVVLLPLRRETDSRYFAHALRVMAKRGFVFVMCPSVRERAPRLRFSTLKDMCVPVPPATEQRVIAEYIQQSTQGLGPALARLQDSLDRLREYRQALITAAVTGQIDVTRDAP